MSEMFRTPLGPYFFSWYYSVIFLTEFEGWHLMFHLIIIFVCQTVAWKLYVCCPEEEKWWRKTAYQLKIVYYWFSTPCLLCSLHWGIVRSCGNFSFILLFSMELQFEYHWENVIVSCVGLCSCWVCILINFDALMKHSRK